MERKVDSGTVFDVDFGRRSDKGNFLAFEYPILQPAVSASGEEFFSKFLFLKP